MSKLPSLYPPQKSVCGLHFVHLFLYLFIKMKALQHRVYYQNEWIQYLFNDVFKMKATSLNVKDVISTFHFLPE